ncbi:MAG: 5-oxoprolinase subunit PxpB [Pseudazoarcus pumilus]|nr:5-oxoprolinase subunit PxpB [Pseudazoarcus pumilus]
MSPQAPSQPATRSAPRFLDLGDRAITVEFGNAIDPALLARVAALDEACARAALPGVVETVPTFRSLSIVFDPLVTSRAELLPALEALLAQDISADTAPARRWRLPACYGGAFSPDLDEVAQRCGISADALVQLHAGREYVVYMLGFLPGFPFMGDVAEALRLPRRAEPRVAVPAGSVAIANGLTAVYPWQSPGGWHLLGHCPVPLFDAGRASPALLAAGDKVCFEVVDAAEYARIAQALATGELAPEAFVGAAT